MKNASKKLILTKTIAIVVVGAMTIGQLAILNDGSMKAQAEAVSSEIVYCDDTIYGHNTVFEGQGVSTTGTYNIYCDEIVTVSSVVQPNVPSYGNGDSSMRNVCGPVAGTNVVGYYDRWYTNLIPNYDPGMVTASGLYRYYPDLALEQTCNVIRSLYDLMNVEEIGGTTSQNFKNGLVSYVNSKGYDLSYSSFYQNETMVNLNKLATAVNQGKVGVVLCSEYNFVYSIRSVDGEDRVIVAKTNSTTAHIMMVFGYQILAFYNNGNHVCTKTFLYTCSGYGSCDIGYMELNDFSVINEALVISIT